MVNGTTVNCARDLAGHVVAEFNNSVGWDRGEVYAGARHLATYANSTTWFDFGADDFFQARTPNGQ